MRRRAARAPRPTGAGILPGQFEPRGEVAEWSKAPHSKCGVRATVPWVRIPPSPPRSLSNCIKMEKCFGQVPESAGLIGGQSVCSEGFQAVDFAAARHLAGPSSLTEWG